MQIFSILSREDLYETNPTFSVAARVSALFRKLDVPLLPFYTTSYVGETYAIFAFLLFGSYALLVGALHPNKSADVILNELVFLGISTTTLFFISIPETLTQPPKNKSFSTDSIPYLSTFFVSVAIMATRSRESSNYVFSPEAVATWSSETWGLCVLNLVILWPFIGLNLRLACRT